MVMTNWRKFLLSPEWWWADRFLHPSQRDLHTCRSLRIQWPGRWWWSFQILQNIRSGKTIYIHTYRSLSYVYVSDLSLLTFLSSVEEGSVLWCVSNLNDLSSSKQLHDKARGDNRRDTQLHQGTWGQMFRLRYSSERAETFDPLLSY